MANQKSNKKSFDEDVKPFFDELKTFINDFTEPILITNVFDYLDQISSKDYLSPTAKAEIINKEYPAIRKFQVRFNDYIKRASDFLEIKHSQQKARDTIAISTVLEDYIQNIQVHINEDTVRNKLLKLTTPEYLQETVEEFGIFMQQKKPHISERFSVEIINRQDLFDDYMGLIESMIDMFVEEVDSFKDHYKTRTSAQREKIKLDLTRNKVKGLRDIIIMEKWESFLKLCDSYTKPVMLKSGEDVVVIKEYSSSGYFWEGIGGGQIPSLAQFIKMLKDNDYLDHKVISEVKIMQAFLQFFNLPSEKENGKYLQKEMKKSANKYIGEFSLHPVNI